MSINIGPIQIPTPAPGESPHPMPGRPGGAITPPGTAGGRAAPAPGGGVGPIPDWQQFIIWLGALVVLWFILSALSEAGYAKEASAIGGLLVFGALLFMGPQAIQNAQALTQPRKAG